MAYQMVAMAVTLLVLVLVFVTEFVIFSFFTIFVFVKENQTASETQKNTQTDFDQLM